MRHVCNTYIEIQMHIIFTFYDCSCVLKNQTWPSMYWSLWTCLIHIRYVSNTYAHMWVRLLKYVCVYNVSIHIYKYAHNALMIYTCKYGPIDVLQTTLTIAVVMTHCKCQINQHRKMICNSMPSHAYLILVKSLKLGRWFGTILCRKETLLVALI